MKRPQAGLRVNFSLNTNTRYGNSQAEAVYSALLTQQDMLLQDLIRETNNADHKAAHAAYLDYRHISETITDLVFILFQLAEENFWAERYERNPAAYQTKASHVRAECWERYDYFMRVYVGIDLGSEDDT